MTIKQIVASLGRHEKSIRRKLKRGTVTLLNSDLSENRTYSADIGENKARRELDAKGPDLKLGADYIFVKKTKELLVKKYSPDAIIMHYENHG